MRYALLAVLSACSFERAIDTGAQSQDADPVEPAVDAPPDARVLADGVDYVCEFPR